MRIKKVQTLDLAPGLGMDLVLVLVLEEPSNTRESQKLSNDQTKLHKQQSQFHLAEQIT